MISINNKQNSFKHFSLINNTFTAWTQPASILENSRVQWQVFVNHLFITHKPCINFQGIHTGSSINFSRLDIFTDI